MFMWVFTWLCVWIPRLVVCVDPIEALTPSDGLGEGLDWTHRQRHGGQGFGGTACGEPHTQGTTDWHLKQHFVTLLHCQSSDIYVYQWFCFGLIIALSPKSAQWIHIKLCHIGDSNIRLSYITIFNLEHGDKKNEIKLQCWCLTKTAACQTQIR